MNTISIRIFDKSDKMTEDYMNEVKIKNGD